MNVLFICNKSPYPPKEGGSIAMYNLIQGLLNKNYNVKVLSISTPKLLVKNSDLNDDFVKKTSFETYFINTSTTLIGALKNLFTNIPYHISRFINHGFSEKIKTVLLQNKYDIIQLESLFVTPYMDTIRKYSKAKIILRAHNIEHVIWERIASNEKNILKKKYLQLQAKRLKNFELHTINKSDGIASITQADLNYFVNNNCQVAITAIPFGIDDTSINEVNVNREFPSVFFLGTLNWLPNTEGLKWFIENVWNIINSKNTEIKFYIAGRHTPEYLKKMAIKNLILVGEVEDALEFMKSKSLMIVPLFSGSGMRVKIIEGMFASNTIISTTIGAEGIEYTNRKNIIIVNTANEFADAILEYASKADLCEEIGRNAKELVLSKYVNTAITEKLIQFYQQIIK